MRPIIIFLSFLVSTICLAGNLDFDSAMGKDHWLYGHYWQTIESPQDIERINLLKDHFYQALQKCTYTNSPRIPKIIHQIWLGSQLPKKFVAYTQTWQDHHPDWEYILWDDKAIDALKLENQELYDKAINYGERSDIARYEILWRYGGLYVDTDFECLQPFDHLHHTYDFYTGIELPGMALFLGQSVILPNGLIASKPHHPIMRSCIKALQKNSHHNDITKRTGPLLFTQMFFETYGPRDIALPALYLYPLDKKTKERTTIKKIITPHTMAIHHWAGSWILQQSAFVPGVELKTRQEGNNMLFSIIDNRSATNSNVKK